MWYRDALSIGKSIGTIQCTYAELFADPNGQQKVFSLQRKKLWNMTQHERYELDHKYYQVDMSWNTEGIVAWDLLGNNKSGVVPEGYIVFDLPLVIADVHSDDRLVPVRLDYNAVDYIKRTLRATKMRPYYVVYDNPEDPQIIRQTFFKPETYTDKKGRLRTRKDDYYVAIYEKISDRFEKLAKMLNENDIFYVKPAAFRWMPIDVSHMNNGTNPEFVKRKNEAYKKMKDAEKVLLLAGISNII